MLAAVRSATLLGVHGLPVTVEVHLANKTLPGFGIVGLPDDACRESRDRVRAAVLSSGLEWPMNARITVNLVPSHQRKGGSGLDLAIALGVLAVSGQLVGAGPQELTRMGVIGELGLDGSIRGIPGVAPMVAALANAVPLVAAASYREALAVAGSAPRSASTLGEVVAALNATAPWPPSPELPADLAEFEALPDLADVRGQSVARSALEVAAAGGHHLLLVGPPGSGKTMIAERLPGILPPLDRITATEATMIHSAIGASLPSTGLVTRAPWCAPHHSASTPSMVGGGSGILRPGLISRAHGGVLFLDEMGEFATDVLDALRQPLEEGVIRISRSGVHGEMPARFLLIGATNPCPCGGGPPGSCECDDAARGRYFRRLSGPFLDRFDLRIAVNRPEVDDLLAAGGGECSAAVAVRVAAARHLALERQGTLNAAVRPGDLDAVIPLAPSAQRLLRGELEADRLTGRGMHRVRRVARTLADLAIVGATDPTLGDPLAPVSAEHVATALGMRVRLRAARVAA